MKYKVVLIGAGMVGSAVLNSILTLDLLSEIVIVDKNENKAMGEALDASHTTSLAYSPNVNVRMGSYADCADAQVIIMTAGPSAKPGQTVSRLSLAGQNVRVMKEVMTSISKYTKDAVIIVATNPVDIVTYYAQNYFDYPREKIFGTGTVLDTARLRRIIAQRYLVDTKNVHGYILGEHGDSAFAAWSLVNISGVPIDRAGPLFGESEPLDREATVQQVVNVGYEIFRLKGYTNLGIAMTISRLVKATLLNELSIVPVSTTLAGEYGISGVSLSLPCILTVNGISRRVEVPLADDEVKKLHRSAEALKSVIAQLDLGSL